MLPSSLSYQLAEPEATVAILLILCVLNCSMDLPDFLVDSLPWFSAKLRRTSSTTTTKLALSASNGSTRLPPNLLSTFWVEAFPSQLSWTSDSSPFLEWSAAWAPATSYTAMAHMSSAMPSHPPAIGFCKWEIYPPSTLFQTLWPSSTIHQPNALTRGSRSLWWLISGRRNSARMLPGWIPWFSSNQSSTL